MGEILHIRPKAIELLERDFNEVSFGKYAGKTVCVIPGVYTPYDGGYPLRDTFKDDKNTRYVTQLLPLQGVGQTAEYSAQDLRVKLISSFALRHIPKPGQPEPIIGDYYRAVTHEDTGHNHESITLHDFTPIYFIEEAAYFHSADHLDGVHYHYTPVAPFQRYI